MKINYKKITGYIVTLLMALSLIGCSSNNNDEKPDSTSKEDEFGSSSSEFDGSADLLPDDYEVPDSYDDLVFNNYVYLNVDSHPGAEPIDVDTLTKDKEKMKVTSNNIEDNNKEGYSTYLPVGTVVYSVKDEPVCLIAEVDGKDILYIQFTPVNN
ncbi:MAG: hypothetical protein ACK5LC_13270 [Coprobacillaceae bacterium]